MKIRKTGRRPSRTPKYSELGHFTLLFCRRQLRNVQRIITLVQSYCSAVNLLFGGVLVAVAVVVCLKSILQTLSNNHSDAKDDAQWKIIIFLLSTVFTYSRTYSSLMCIASIEFQIKIRKLTTAVCVLQNTQNVLTSRWCFAEDC